MSHSHQSTCSGCFEEHTGVPELLNELNQCGKDELSVLKVLKNQMESDNMFKKP